MEILGTNFAITLGSWRLRFCLAVEDVDEPAPPKRQTPHRIRVIEEAPHARRRRANAN